MKKQRSSIHFDIKKGLLHEALGVPKDAKIPMLMLMAHRNSSDPHMRRMINFALNSRKFKH